MEEEDNNDRRKEGREKKELRNYT